MLLDVRMPDLSGIEVLDQLQKSGAAPSVIMITADPQLDDVKAARLVSRVGRKLDSRGRTFEALKQAGEKTVTYLVGTSPSVTVFRDMFKR